MDNSAPFFDPGPTRRRLHHDDAGLLRRLLASIERGINQLQTSLRALSESEHALRGADETLAAARTVILGKHFAPTNLASGTTVDSSSTARFDGVESDHHIS